MYFTSWFVLLVNVCSVHLHLHNENVRERKREMGDVNYILGENGNSSRR